MTDLDPRVQAMLDRDEIRGLTELYCHYIWQKDMKVIDLFASDGVFMANANAPERAVRGRDALEAEYRRILDGSSPLPFIHNHVIEFQDAEHATGWCYLDVRLAVEGTYRNLGMAYYNDTYVRIDGVWKFQERRVNFVSTMRTALA